MRRHNLWRAVLAISLAPWLLALVFLLAGCASNDLKPPETEIFCSVTRDRAVALNNVKALELGLRIAPHQTATLCPVPVAVPVPAKAASAS